LRWRRRPADSQRRPSPRPSAMDLDARGRCGYFQGPRHGPFGPG
jgi:hypothetical protein